MVLKKHLLLITLFTFTLNISCIPCWATNHEDDEESGLHPSPTRTLLANEVDQRATSTYGSTNMRQEITYDEDRSSCWNICGGLFMIGSCVGLLIYLLAHLKLSH